MGEIGKIVQAPEDLVAPVNVPAEAYISPDYARAEVDRLWRKVWLQAGRLEDIPEVGDYITFDIVHDSVIIVRASAQEIRAFHNVCPHRGRKLVDVPAGKRNARGTRKNFICGYHGWTFGLDGANTYVEHQEDWQGHLCGGLADLGTVRVDTWGGWIWINLDAEAGPLAEYLNPAAAMLDPYGLENMRPGGASG
ncbi:aromatic ring-hydroxylating dioxygenase subunit alpha [Novosphingobium panipatense]